MCSEHGRLPCQLAKISLFFSLPVRDWMLFLPENGIVGGEGHPRPLHYGVCLINSFSQWSLVAPISCLLFLTVLLPTENENQSSERK